MLGILTTRPWIGDQSAVLGNFGQTNYGAAKAGIAGFMRCLAIEAAKANVNVLAPNAYSRMTASLFPEGSEERYAPEKVSPAIAWLCSDESESIIHRWQRQRGGVPNLDCARPGYRNHVDGIGTALSWKPPQRCRHGYLVPRGPKNHRGRESR